MSAKSDSREEDIYTGWHGGVSGRDAVVVAAALPVVVVQVVSVAGNDKVVQVVVV